MSAASELMTTASRLDEPADVVWSSIARGYASFGVPLVPCQVDISSYEHALQSAAEIAGTRGLEAVLLGVTPSIVTMNWPLGSRLTAVDMSRSVINALWPGDIPGVRKVVCASWMSMPIMHDTCDLVVGDGSFIACRYPEETRALARSVSDVLRKGGVFAIRIYITPPSPESVDQVFQALFEKRLGVDGFKLALWISMQRSSAEGVAVREAAEVMRKYHVDVDVMRDGFGWSADAVAPFQAWPTAGAVYTFPTLSEFRSVMAESFHEMWIEWPTYHLGDCCPLVVMRKK